MIKQSQQKTIVHETAICNNPPTNNFTGDRKTSLIFNRPTLKHVMFLQKCKDKQFFCGHNILTEVEFVNQPSSNARISI